MGVPSSTRRGGPRRSIAPMRREMVVVVLLVLLGVGCGRAGGEPFQPTLNGVVPLSDDPGGMVAQMINPAGEAVSAVAVEVATYAAPADPDGVLTLRLRDPDGGAVLAAGEVRGADLADATWAQVRFDPPVAVADLVLLEATWSGATPLALWANTAPQERDPAVQDANDPYPGGSLLIDGQPVEGDLVFRVQGGGGLATALRQVAEVVRSAASRATAQPLFALVWVMALTGSTIMAVRGLRGSG